MNSLEVEAHNRSDFMEIIICFVKMFKCRMGLQGDEGKKNRIEFFVVVVKTNTLRGFVVEHRILK